jgi:cation transport ATPase
MNEKRFEDERAGDRDWKRKKAEQERRFKQKKESAEEIRRHGRALITIGIFGFFLSGIALTLTFIPDILSQYDPFISIYGGTLALAIALFVVYRRRAISSLKESITE